MRKKIIQKFQVPLTSNITEIVKDNFITLRFCYLMNEVSKLTLYLGLNHSDDGELVTHAWLFTAQSYKP